MLACWNRPKKVAEQVDDDRGLRADPEAEHQRQAADEGEAERVERVEIERAPDVDALGAVVHLVEPAPQERRVVHRPVPGIDAELERQEAAGDLRPERQACRPRTAGAGRASRPRTRARRSPARSRAA